MENTLSGFIIWLLQMAAVLGIAALVLLFMGGLLVIADGKRISQTNVSDKPRQITVDEKKECHNIASVCAWVLLLVLIFIAVQQ